MLTAGAIRKPQTVLASLSTPKSLRSVRESFTGPGSVLSTSPTGATGATKSAMGQRYGRSLSLPSTFPDVPNQFSLAQDGHVGSDL